MTGRPEGFEKRGVIEPGRTPPDKSTKTAAERPLESDLTRRMAERADQKSKVKD